MELSQERIKEIGDKVFNKYSINAELYPTEDLQNTYKAGVIDGYLYVFEELEKSVKNIEIINK